MSTPYMGSTDAQRRDWLVNFSNKLVASPSSYQVASADATTVSVAVAAFVAAYLVAIDPSTRTKSSIEEKDQTRNDATAIARVYAQQIKLNNGVSDQDKIDAGIPLVNDSRSPRNVPDSSPLANVLGATPGSHTLRYSDSATPDSPAKPFGAECVQVFVAIAEEPTVNADDAAFYGAFKKNPISVGFAQADDGKMCTYFLRWAGGDGEVGPWSLPVSMRIAA